MSSAGAIFVHHSRCNRELSYWRNERLTRLGPVENTAAKLLIIIELLIAKVNRFTFSLHRRKISDDLRVDPASDRSPAVKRTQALGILRGKLDAFFMRRQTSGIEPKAKSLT
jgi:hypothetical protein